MRRAWIEIKNVESTSLSPTVSLSMRRAWIEICDVYAVTYQANNVALHAESVDRNLLRKKHFIFRIKVALHAESVDRNVDGDLLLPQNMVALHAESVDRNFNSVICQAVCCQVALHAESVDRNKDMTDEEKAAHPSLSMRRAWIEIWLTPCILCQFDVALHAESVDRNTYAINMI